MPEKINNKSYQYQKIENISNNFEQAIQGTNGRIVGLEQTL